MLNIDKVKTNGYKVDTVLSDIFDSAIVGVTGEDKPALVYSYNIMLSILIEKGWGYTDAEEYLTYTLPACFELMEINLPIIIHTIEHL